MMYPVRQAVRPDICWQLPRLHLAFLKKKKKMSNQNSDSIFISLITILMQLSKATNSSTSRSMDYPFLLGNLWRSFLTKRNFNAVRVIILKRLYFVERSSESVFKIHYLNSPKHLLSNLAINSRRRVGHSAWCLNMFYTTYKKN